METDYWGIDVNVTANGYFKSEGTQRNVCLSGRAAHDACFTVIREFPLEVIVGETPLNGLGLR